MTREQLIDAARTAAKFLPVASAQLMNELANRLDITSVALCESMQQRSALAIENTVLRDDVTCWAKECDRIVERHTKTDSNMHLLEAQRELKELTPDTDKVKLELKAAGVKELARKFGEDKESLSPEVFAYGEVLEALTMAENEAENFAYHLLHGSNQPCKVCGGSACSSFGCCATDQILKDQSEGSI
jgi:hypothetical protein